MSQDQRIDYPQRAAAAGIVLAVAVAVVGAIWVRWQQPPHPPQTAVETTAPENDPSPQMVGLALPVHRYMPADHTSQTVKVRDLNALYPASDPPRISEVMAVPLSGCDVTLAAVAQPPAMVQLSLGAPCLPSSRFVVRHAEVAFTITTDAEGKGQLMVPALDVVAEFAAVHDNLLYAVTDVRVPDKVLYDRVAIHWETDQPLNLHAFDETAFIGGPGHIWEAAPGSADAVVSGQGGYLFSHHAEDAVFPINTEVFTFPAGRSVEDGLTGLRLSNLLNPRNCGREVDLQVVEAVRQSPRRVTGVTAQMPLCDQIGYVVLLAKDLPTLVAEQR